MEPTTILSESDTSLDNGSDSLVCRGEKFDIDGIHKLTDPAEKLYVWDEYTQPSTRSDIPPHASEAQRKYWNEVFDSLESNVEAPTVARIRTHKGRMASNKQRPESPYIPEKVRPSIRDSPTLESENSIDSGTYERRTELDSGSECEYRPSTITQSFNKNRKIQQRPENDHSNPGKHIKQKNKTVSDKMATTLAPETTRTSAEKAKAIIDDITTPRRSRRHMDTESRNTVKRRLNFDVGGDDSPEKRTLRTQSPNTEEPETSTIKRLRDDNQHVPTTSPNFTKPNILKKRKLLQFTYESRTDGGNTNDRIEPSASTSKSGGRPLPDTDSEYESDIPSNLYTFIWHPKQQETLDSLGHTHAFKKNAKGRRPDYTYFIHGNTVGHGHIHVIFTATSNSIGRKRERICRDLPNCASKEPEITATTIAIKADTGTNFAAYCGRRGGGTHFRVGSGVKEIEDFYNSFTNDIEQIAQDACTQFFQKKRNARKQQLTGNLLTDPDGFEEDSGTVYQKMYTILDPYLKRYRPENLTEFHKKLPLDIQIECMKMWGTRFESFAKSIINMQRTHDLQTKKNTPFIDLAFDYIKKDIYITPISRDEVLQAYRWLTYVFTMNGIDMIEFFGKFLLIQDMALPKLNSFVLRGQLNTGKSMLLNLLLECVEPALIMRMGDASQFYLQNLVTAPAVLFEEPTITNMSINTFKLLMGGEKCATDVKNQNTHTIYRLPNYYTTNIALGADCAPIHQQALKIRMFEFVMNVVIENDKVNGAIKRAPVPITSTILYLIILAHIHEISVWQLANFPNAKIKYDIDKKGMAYEDSRPFGHDLDWLRRLDIQKPTTSQDSLGELIGSDVTRDYYNSKF